MFPKQEALLWLKKDYLLAKSTKLTVGLLVKENYGLLSLDFCSYDNPLLNECIHKILENPTNMVQQQLFLGHIMKEGTDMTTSRRTPSNMDLGVNPGKQILAWLWI